MYRIDWVAHGRDWLIRQRAGWDLPRSNVVGWATGEQHWLHRRASCIGWLRRRGSVGICRGVKLALVGLLRHGRCWRVARQRWFWLGGRLVGAPGATVVCLDLHCLGHQGARWAWLRLAEAGSVGHGFRSTGFVRQGLINVCGCQGGIRLEVRLPSSECRILARCGVWQSVKRPRALRCLIVWERHRRG